MLSIPESFLFTLDASVQVSLHFTYEWIWSYHSIVAEGFRKVVTEKDCRRNKGGRWNKDKWENEGENTGETEKGDIKSEIWGKGQKMTAHKILPNVEWKQNIIWSKRKKEERKIKGERINRRMTTWKIKTCWEMKQSLCCFFLLMFSCPISIIYECVILSV